MPALSPETQPEITAEITAEFQPIEQDSVITFDDETEDFSGYIAFITGHMFDHPGRKIPRFPESNVETVRSGLRAALDKVHAKNPVSKIVCSGTAGVDLLATEWALDNNVSVVLYLPYDEDSFVNGAVAYSEKYGEVMRLIFDRVKIDHNSRVYLPSLQDGQPATELTVQAASTLTGNPYKHYADLNAHMVSKLKPRDMVIAVWDGKGGDSPGGTEHAVRSAVGKGTDFTLITEGIENVAQEYPTI